MNLGGKNTLRMADLRTLLEELGCTDVTTLLQSGNAVFTTKLGASAVTTQIDAALATHMRKPIDTTLRTRDELQAVVDDNPLADVATDPTFLCVTFLSKAPAEAAVAPVITRDWSPERVRIAGREIYTWHPNGQARSPLAAALGKLRLPGTATTRNWNTVSKLLEMMK